MRTIGKVIKCELWVRCNTLSGCIDDAMYLKQDLADQYDGGCYNIRVLIYVEELRKSYKIRQCYGIGILAEMMERHPPEDVVLVFEVGRRFGMAKN